MLELRDLKLYRWWKGGTWTLMSIASGCPFVYWTRQPNLYSDVVVICREIYNHQRDIRNERYE